MQKGSLEQVLQAQSNSVTKHRLQGISTGEFNVPANTCQASSALAVKLRNIYPYPPTGGLPTSPPKLRV